MTHDYLDTFLDGYKQREDAASSGNAKRLCHIEIKRAELTKETSIKDGIYIIKINMSEALRKRPKPYSVFFF